MLRADPKERLTAIDVLSKFQPCKNCIDMNLFVGTKNGLKVSKTMTLKNPHSVVSILPKRKKREDALNYRSAFHYKGHSVVCLMHDTEVGYMLNILE